MQEGSLSDSEPDGPGDISGAIERLDASVDSSSLQEQDDSINNPDLQQRLTEEVGINSGQAARVIQIIREESHAYSGPIPQAAELKRLNEVSPNLGTRIAEDYLENRAHERIMNRRVLRLARADSNRKHGWLEYAKRGQNFGMASQVMFVACSVGCACFHYLTLAAIFIAPPAFGVIAQFIKGAPRGESMSSGNRSSNQPKKQDQSDSEDE